VLARNALIRNGQNMRDRLFDALAEIFKILIYNINISDFVSKRKELQRCILIFAGIVSDP
jgi:hypothetical protein